MDFLATPFRRKLLFSSLYLSEGAPIGFIWWALPARLRGEGVDVAEITALTAALVLPWTFKFAWAPLVDLLQGPRWTLKSWALTAQALMSLTLLPLLWLDLKADFALVAGLLLVHAFTAATQDVSIDALCISVTSPAERGQYNGWMQAGMLLGRSLLGGGALILAARIDVLAKLIPIAYPSWGGIWPIPHLSGDSAIVALLVLTTSFSMILLWMSRPKAHATPAVAERPKQETQPRYRVVLSSAWRAIKRPSTWLGLGFALLGGAAFESLGAVQQPLLVDRGYSQEQIGWFIAVPVVTAMIVGSIAGGWLADRLGKRTFVAIALLFMVAAVAGVAVSDWASGGRGGTHLLLFLGAVALGIGLFNAASYALFMDITTRGVAATQFSAFMGATNGCESWAGFSIGRLLSPRGAQLGYPFSLLFMCGISLAALPLLLLLGRPTTSSE